VAHVRSEVRPLLSVIIPTHNNLAILRRCIERWSTVAPDVPVEIIVIEDGCTDGTHEYLAEVAATEWGVRTLRAVHEDNVHELMCTNRGLREARAPLVMSWHDDMFLRKAWLVDELIATFGAYPEIGLLSLSRGLVLGACKGLPETWEESISWERVQSTIGPAPLNWLRLHEVDVVMRPWVVRAECVRRVGMLDEAFRPTEWDEADLCMRIREAGWRIATHGFERAGAYEHMLSSTVSRTPSEKRMSIGLRNARIFFERWCPQVDRASGRVRRTWRRRASGRGLGDTAWQMMRFAFGRRGAS
jgi:glycosyltransferase involved in cell wall biosynthesis